MKDGRAGVALYAVSSDLDGAKIRREMRARFDRAIVEMLESASEPLKTDPQLVASMLQGAMVGTAQRLLESDEPEKQLEVLGEELTRVACAYLDACCG